LKKYIFIGIGGFLGALARYGIKQIHFSGYSGKFPFNTLIINIIGSFLLAFILALTIRMPRFGDDLKARLTVGFLGAFTTFSALCRETVELIITGRYSSAVGYAGLSIITGLAAVGLGATAAEWLWTLVAGSDQSGQAACTENKTEYDTI
jgi:CrcB protein